jgi:hypothetical protein
MLLCCALRRSDDAANRDGRGQRTHTFQRQALGVIIAPSDGAPERWWEMRAPSLRRAHPHPPAWRSRRRTRGLQITE